MRQQESNLSARGLEPLRTPSRDRPAWTPLCRTAGQRNRRPPQTSDLSSADLSLSSRLTRTGGTSAGAMRGIGCSPRYAVIRPDNPLCTVFHLYAARPSVSAYRYSRVATPPRVSESNRPARLRDINRQVITGTLLHRADTGYKLQGGIEPPPSEYKSVALPTKLLERVRFQMRFDLSAFAFGYSP